MRCLVCGEEVSEDKVSLSFIETDEVVCSDCVKQDGCNCAGACEDCRCLTR